MNLSIQNLCTAAPGQDSFQKGCSRLREAYGVLSRGRRCALDEIVSNCQPELPLQAIIFLRPVREPDCLLQVPSQRHSDSLLQGQVSLCDARLLSMFPSFMQGVDPQQDIAQMFKCPVIANWHPKVKGIFSRLEEPLT